MNMNSPGNLRNHTLHQTAVQQTYLYFQRGVPRTTHRVLRGAPPSVAGPGLAAHRLFGTSAPIPQGGTCVSSSHPIPIPERQLATAQECVQLFYRWCWQKKKFGSSASGVKELVVNISMPNFLLFKKELNVHNDERFPKYTYNSAIQTLTFQCMPGPLHAKCVSIIAQGLWCMSSKLPLKIMDQVHIVGNQQFTEFQREYSGSDKTPDTALQISDESGNCYVKFVLEVGFTESYNSLVEDAKMWLDGMDSVSCILLVKILETPDYHCPYRNLSNNAFNQLNFLRSDEVTAQTFMLETGYGPAVYKDRVWVGKISGFLEIWRRDPISKLAAPFGDRVNLFNFSEVEKVTFQLSEFLDAPQAGKHQITFDWRRYFHNIGMDIKELAVERYKRMLNYRQELADVKDQDYQPQPSLSSGESSQQ